MIGYSLRISELKELEGLHVPDEVKHWKLEAKSPQELRDLLEGELVIFIDRLQPWLALGPLLKDVRAADTGEGVLHEGGYPYLFVARGSRVLQHIADTVGSKHGELHELLDPEDFYLLEAWDQS